MIEEVRRLMDSYAAWLKDKTTLREIAGTVEITTPLLDRHNDYLQLYVKKRDTGYILTDDGYTIQDLELSGCKLETRKRQDILKMTLAGFGVQRDGNALTVTATPATFSLQKHNLVQAMLAVNDLFYLAEPTVLSVFTEDVSQWLNLHDVRVLKSIPLHGKSGLTHVFDFAIPPSRTKPERVIRAIGHPNKSAAVNLAFAWLDSRESRPPNARAYAFLNDAHQPVPADVTETLSIYEVMAVPWSQRDNVRVALSN
jgi:hypothetical protein